MKNFYTGREKELDGMAKEYEKAMKEQQPYYQDADEMADLADWYAMRHHASTGMQVIEYGLKLHPNETSLLVEKAYLYFDNDQLEKAEEIAAGIQDNYSDEVKILRANLLYEREKKEEAEAQIASVCEKDDISNITDIGYLYIDRGMDKEALKWIEHGHELGTYENDESFMALQASYYCMVEDYEQAKICLNKLIDHNPYNSACWIDLGRIAFEEGDFGRAIDCADFAIVGDEDCGEAYLLRANAYNELGNCQQALEEFQHCQTLGLVSQAFVDALRGQDCVNRSDWENGLKALESAMKDLDNAMYPATGIYCNYALCLSYTDQKKEAHCYCQKARELDPGFLFVYLIEGRIYLEEDKIKEAAMQWSIALELEKERNVSIWYEIGTCLLDTGHLKYARTAYEQCYKIDPNYSDVAGVLTAICLFMEDKDAAEAYRKHFNGTNLPIHHTDMTFLNRKQEDNEDFLEMINA